MGKGLKGSGGTVECCLLGASLPLDIEGSGGVMDEYFLGRDCELHSYWLRQSGIASTFFV